MLYWILSISNASGYVGFHKFRTHILIFQSIDKLDMAKYNIEIVETTLSKNKKCGLLRVACYFTIGAKDIRVLLI